MLEAIRASRDVRGVLWGWQGIGSIRGHWSLLGGVGVLEPLGGIRGLRGVGVPGVYWGLARSVGTHRPEWA